MNALGTHLKNAPRPSLAGLIAQGLDRGFTSGLGLNFTENVRPRRDRLPRDLTVGILVDRSNLTKNIGFLHNGLPNLAAVDIGDDRPSPTERVRGTSHNFSDRLTEIIFYESPDFTDVVGPLRHDRLDQSSP